MYCKKVCIKDEVGHSMWVVSFISSSIPLGMIVTIVKTKVSKSKFVDNDVELRLEFQTIVLL